MLQGINMNGNVMSENDCVFWKRKLKNKDFSISFIEKICFKGNVLKKSNF